MIPPKLNPDQWYHGRVIEVHPNWTWLKIQEPLTQQIYVLDGAYNAVGLEVTVEKNKDVKFKLNSDLKVNEIERERDGKSEKF